jgi:hypothetical protein
MDQGALNLFQILTQAGATPGQDFSFNPDDQTCIVTEQGYQLLKSAYPDMDWDSIFGVYEPDPSAAIAAIHDHLGVNFVDRILERINRRIREMPTSKGAWYLRQILAGVEQRTGVSLYSLLNDRLSLSRRARVECLLHPEVEPEPCGEWIGDLVQAAGGQRQDVKIDGAEAVLTERGVRLLAIVWAGECNLYEELANGLG